jgi:hypothetical protein
MQRDDAPGVVGLLARVALSVYPPLMGLKIAIWLVDVVLRTTARMHVGLLAIGSRGLELAHKAWQNGTPIRA